MYYSIFVILYCIILAVIAIDGFSIKKSRKTSTYVCFFDFLFFNSKRRYYDSIVNSLFTCFDVDLL